uniref:Uncharacterized protein n=1 Tax=Oryza meridionalis TaxID=40149 RepID=A0A0E0CJA6_9ORYZ
MATLSPTSLPNWNRMRISVNIITQNRTKSLRLLLASLRNTYYVGDEVVPISFNMDSRVDVATLNAVNSSDAEPQQDLSIVMNLLYIKACALLIHHRWKMESILDHMLREGRDRMLREAGVVIQQQQAEEKNSSGGTAMAPPPPRPGSSVTCYVCFEETPISFNMDSRVDAATLNAVNSFDWPHGGKMLQRRIIQGELIRTQRTGGQRPLYT